MKQLLLTVALASLALTACNRDAQNAPVAQTPAAAPATDAAGDAAPAKKKRQPVASPEEIAAIRDSGKTGLWSEVTEVCAKDTKRGVPTTLSWNVEDKGAKRVVVYVIGKKGEERNFGQGGPVGRKDTGPWLLPGTIFRLRDLDSKEQLAEVTIGDKPC